MFGVVTLLRYGSRHIGKNMDGNSDGSVVERPPAESRKLASEYNEDERSEAARQTEIGEQLYEKYRTQLEREHFGQYVVFNTETGGYAIGASHLDAIDAYRGQYGDAPGWCRGIGFLSRV